MEPEESYRWPEQQGQEPMPDYAAEAEKCWNEKGDEAVSTKIYGVSDDLIEAEGDVSGEVGYYTNREEDDAGCLLVCSDGTLLTARYGKPSGGIWALAILHRGSLLTDLVICENEDATPSSDVAVFADGLRWIYAATRWEKVK